MFLIYLALWFAYTIIQITFVSRIERRLLMTDTGFAVGSLKGAPALYFVNFSIGQKN